MRWKVVIKSCTIVFVLFVLGACSTNNEEYIVKSGSITESVFASGNIMAGNEYKVFASGNGRLLRIVKKVGESVRKGDTILVMDADRLDAMRSSTIDAYQLAESNADENGPVLGELNARLNAALTKYKHDSIQFARYTNLFKENACSKLDLDRAQLAFNISKDEWIAANNRLKQTRASLRTSLQSASNQVKLSNKDAEEYYVISKIDGRVLNLFYDQGEMIVRSTPVAIIGNDQSYSIQLIVDELDMAKIEAGQKAFIRMNAYPEKVLDAEIVSIFPFIDNRIQSFRADAVFTSEIPVLMSGMALEANILCQSKENVIMVPLKYLVGKDSVLLSSNQRVKVETGLRTLDNVEIISGLQTGDRILLPER
ncbi:MAG TPA: efflux RND transporter periplasmic adaptor subunit [Bacteroidia bacterium]|nr:efflux RND transporter periplasmic adaptor subunit [Bacteroidia bacterium]HNT80923.1 efflux RND transporter periplasmic adaptor subunit [Bacteroidia bacterium]